VDASTLSADERTWLDSYHDRVFRLIGPQLEPEAAAWLQLQCQPLES
jgi:Xaa-Pro aminopeptidase